MTRRRPRKRIFIEPPQGKKKVDLERCLGSEEVEARIRGVWRRKGAYEVEVEESEDVEKLRKVKKLEEEGYKVGEPVKGVKPRIVILTCLRYNTGPHGIGRYS